MKSRHLRANRQSASTRRLVEMIAAKRAARVRRWAVLPVRQHGWEEVICGR